MLRKYFAGAEIPSWRKLLHECGVQHMALSFVGLTRRVKNTSAWHIADKLPPGSSILLESGAFSINKNPDDYDIDDVFARYLAFVQTNVVDVDLVTDFNIATHTDEQRDSTRIQLDEAAGGKFLPIWQPDEGLAVLRELADTYHRVGVPQTALGGRDLTPYLINLAKSGVKLHGVAMTQMDAMRAIPWDSVASSSWLSPAQYQDTIVWTGHELKRYPKRYKDQARKRHRTYLAANGFDTEAIEAGQANELLKLSIWSWKQYVDHINNTRNRGGVNPPPESDTDTYAENALEPVDQPPARARNSTPTPRSTRATLPGSQIDLKTIKETGEDGVRRNRDIPMLATVERSQRVCDSCFLATKCPQWEPGNECAFDLPVEARTRDQLGRLQEVLIEMQTQRLLFARFAEELEGGYPDPNVGNEMDRLQKMLKTKADLDSEGFTLTVKAQSRASGETGMFGRIFGSDASQAARAIEPVQAEQVAADLGIMDAEIVESMS